MQPSLEKKDIQLINVEKAYQGFFSLDKLQLKFRLYDGNWSEVVFREIFKKGQAVGILLYDIKKQEVILTEQLRLGALEDKTSPWLLEIVAGIIEKGDSVIHTVHKEVYEESGLDILALEKICEYWVSPGGNDEYFYLYCACIDSTNMQMYGGLQQEAEDIKLHSLSIDKAQRLLKANRLNNASTIIALQWLQMNLDKLNDKWKNEMEDNNI